MYVPRQTSCIVYMYTGLYFVQFQNPGISDVYTQHSVEATAARYAPSGYYIASGGLS